MRLEQAEITLRKRRFWETLDLGLLLARRWYGPLLALWCIGIVCFLPLLWLAFSLDHFYLGFFLFWFVLPLPECLTLLWSGEALFGRRLGIRQTLTTFREQCSLGRALLLLCYLPHPRRFHAFSVLMLEGGTRQEAKERIAMLGRGRESGVGFPLMAQIVTGLLWLAAISISSELVPDGLSQLFDMWDFTLLLCILYITVAGLLAPVWATCGFMLYISRRVELEGWDLELGFRDLNLRLKREKGGKA